MTYEKMKWYPFDKKASTCLDMFTEVAFVAKDVRLDRGQSFRYTTDIHVGWVRWVETDKVNIANWSYDFLPTHFMILSLPE